MPIRIIYVTELREGSYAIIENAPCVIKSIEISKTGKHGHAKARIEAVGVIDDKKRVLVLPGHERVEVPLIEKKRGQVLSIAERASVMDLESFETLEISIPAELKEQLKEGVQVEYWDVEGQKVIKRVMGGQQ
jgi:translation initiation factor 5A